MLSASRPYVLLVDDHAGTRKTLREIVRGAGYPCVAAGSATEAISYCEGRRPQVVVTDLVMPNLDGRGLARWLKARYPSVPLILLSGQSFDPSALVELRRIFTEVLSKPVDVELLLDRIERLMPRHASVTRP